jgi:cell division protease FtsH
MDRKTRFNIWFWVAAFFGLLFFQSVYLAATQVAPIPYSEFLEHLRAGKVEEVAVSDKQISGKLEQPLESGQRPNREHFPA